MKIFLVIVFLSTKLVAQAVKPFGRSQTRDFSMPSISSNGVTTPGFDVKDSKMPPISGRKLQMGGKPPGPSPVVAPVQFPGILNPDIYIQNTQSAPVFPQMNAPPVSMNLHINGLESYYKPTPPIVHTIHHYHPRDDPLKALYNM